MNMHENVWNSIWKGDEEAERQQGGGRQRRREA